ncbi:MAG: SEC-C domain-containing protein [Oscillospiraceae bacterium]|nr:SEC-C domain-containing protein [Oscillospiraceae bacterium]
MTITEILSAKKRDELASLAKALKIPKYSSMKKAELVSALANTINTENAPITGDAEIIALFKEDDTLHLYALAATHLYGAIKVSAFCELVSRYEGREYTIDEVKSALTYKDTVLPYCFIGNHLANAIFTQEPENLTQLIAEAADVIRYVPDKEQFLKYASEEYFEENLQYKNLAAVLGNAMNDEKLGHHLAAEARKLFAMGSSLQDCVMVLQACGVQPNEDTAPVWKLNMMIQNAFAASRLWKHRGHTEEEAAKQKTPDRNEKCLCGSGLKYKKCCAGR